MVSEATTTVRVPPARWERWVENFRTRHGETGCEVDEGQLVGTALDGSTFAAALPFGRRYQGPPDVEPFAAQADPPAEWGVLLVRKGGFAVARLVGGEIAASKVGQRHVQGRTKAGGQSQQRFARRRAQQARVAYGAAAEHADRILGGLAPDAPLVTGGDRAAVAAVLEDHRLAPRAASVVEPWLAVPDPRRSVLEDAVRDAGALHVHVRNR